MFEGTLLEMARSRARCALGLELDIFGNDLGAVPYKNLMNRSPISPNGSMPMAMVLVLGFDQLFVLWLRLL